jgi:hypothetical protein
MALSERQAERIKEGCIIDSQKMASQTHCDLKIEFDEGRNHSQGIKNPVHKDYQPLRKVYQGCTPNLGLTTPENWLLSILITLFPV